MNYTYQEMKNQYDAIKRTYDYLLDKKSLLHDCFMKEGKKRIVLTGCGSSYLLCKSGEILMTNRLGYNVLSIPSGDLLLNINDYKNILNDSIILVLSRSGETSEVVEAVSNIRRDNDVRVLSVILSTGSPLEKLSDYCLLLPWAFDQSTCQTRSVSNLYLALALITAILSNDNDLIKDIHTVAQTGKAFLDLNEEAFKQVGRTSFNNVTILADGEVRGIAEEGALAFCEIASTPAYHRHLLDVRHGASLLINKDTLVIIALNKNNNGYQRALLNDMVKIAGCVVSFYGPEELNTPSYKNISINRDIDSVCYGFHIINICQMISYYKAAKEGINPDKPEGLRPWIKL